MAAGRRAHRLPLLLAAACLLIGFCLFGEPSRFRSTVAALERALGATLSLGVATPAAPRRPSPTPATAFAPLRINAGGGAYTDTAGHQWAADTGFTGGINYTHAMARIRGTADQALYQSERTGTFSYSFPVPPGAYSVTLKFAETFWPTPGSRVFSVSIEGQPVLNNVDLLRLTPPNTALDRVFLTYVRDGTLDITFTTLKDNATVSAIQIVRATGLLPPRLGTSVPPPASGIRGLHVRGNQILNGAGHLLRLLGVSRAGSEYACIQGWGVFDGPNDDASVRAIASWHVNAVRVPLNEDCWLNINGVPAAYGGINYQRMIAAYVALLNRYGLIAILDLHWSGPDSTPAKGQQPMPDRDHAVTFWRQVARSYKGNSAVVFDLFNEPYPDYNRVTQAGWRCWRDGGTCPGVAFPVAGMQELVAAIRSTGATNVIMLGGLQYANDLSQWLAYKPADPAGNLVASWHSYNFNICATVSCWESVIAPVARKVPLVAGEIGENDCAHTYIDRLMAWLDRHRQSYLGWTWNTWGCGSGPALISDYGGTPTFFGVGYRDHLYVVHGQAPPPPPPTSTPTAVPTPPPPLRSFPIGINAGGPAYTATDGTPYLADSYYSGSSQVLSTTARIAGTRDPVLYQTERYGWNFTYAFSVPNNRTYDVTLKFAETYFPPGRRYFDIYINGTKVQYLVDLYKWAGGQNIAYDETFTVRVTRGVMAINLEGSSREATLRALRIAYHTGTAIPTALPQSSGSLPEASRPTNPRLLTAGALPGRALQLRDS